MNYVYLSPHFDDAVFSCGGLIWQQSQAGHTVEVLTVCGGEPPSHELFPFAAELHRRWGHGLEVVASRRAEDAQACAAAGAIQRWLTIPDCIYRSYPDTGRPLVEKNDDLFRTDLPDEETALRMIAAELSALPAETQVVCPLTAGGHIDHRLALQAALRSQRPLWFYADFPYSARKNVSLESGLLDGCRASEIILDQQALDKWVQAALCYQSQISTFWPSNQAAGEAIQAYYRSNSYGHTIWQRD